METNNRFLESLKSGIAELWNHKWKILFLIPYIIFAVYFFIKYINMDHTLLKNISESFYILAKAIIDIFIEESNFDLDSFYFWIRVIAYSFITVFEGLIALWIVTLIGKMPSTNIIQKKLSKIKFHNNLTCRYKYKKRDKENLHGIKVCLEGEGLIKKDYADELERIESALRKYTIYKIKQDELDKALMYLYCIPNKYVKLKEISIYEDFLTKDFINLLLTGRYRNWKKYYIVCANGNVFEKI